MKKLIIVTVIVTRLVLCAVVWPQTEVVKKPPAPLQVTAVSAPEPTVEGIAAEAETTPLRRSG